METILQFGALLLLLCPLIASDSVSFSVQFPFCSNAPNQALQIVCTQLYRWDSQVREHSFTASWTSWTTTTTYTDSHSRVLSKSTTWSSWSSWASSDSAPQQHSDSGYSVTYGNQPSTYRSRSSSSAATSEGSSSDCCGGSLSAHSFSLQSQQPSSASYNQKFYAVRTDGSGNYQAQAQRCDTSTQRCTTRIITNPYECMTLLCLCVFFQGTISGAACRLPSGENLQRSIRREYRQLSVEERTRLHSALVRMKRSGEYDRIASWHSHPDHSGGAHSGPAFLPWHREYLKRFEIALRMIDPTLSLPYWDSTLDSRIPEGTESCLFSSDLAGECDSRGDLVNGFASSWTSPQSHARLRRHVGVQGRPLNERDIETVMLHGDIRDVMAYSTPMQNCGQSADWTCIEYSHGNVLIWVGGEMFSPMTAANDPLFFMHHAFVDQVWEDWRRQHESRGKRSILYPPDSFNCSSSEHFANSPMRPFSPLRNVDGISTAYTVELYEYAPRPSCVSRDDQCGSEYLFCDLSHGRPHCATKIRTGGHCNGYTRSESCCYKSRCFSGLCTTVTELTVVSSRPQYEEHTVSTVEMSCYNEHECCAIWASRGLCQRRTVYMDHWCKASCRRCEPYYDLFSKDCSDRHAKCAYWARQGECRVNVHWMAENCRVSCALCTRNRIETCPRSPPRRF